MNQLFSLASLIRLANEEKTISVIGFNLEFPVPQSDIAEEHIPEWTTFLESQIGILKGETGNTLEDACAKLVKVCQEKSFVIPTTTVEAVIPNNKQTEEFISMLQEILFEVGGPALVLFFEYWPEFTLSKLAWRAGIASASRWASGYIIEVKESSFYEVCTKLWEQLQAMKDEIKNKYKKL